MHKDFQSKWQYDNFFAQWCHLGESSGNIQRQAATRDEYWDGKDILNKRRVHVELLQRKDHQSLQN